MRKTYLSKSKILSGTQCHKRLYLEMHHPELAETSAEAERRFATGHDVCEVARRLWPKGILIQHDNELTQAIAETRALLAKPGPVTLFEATVEAEGVLVRADILERGKQKLRLVEVKSSSTLKEHYLLDVAVQVWVLTRTGLKPDRVELAHINTDFVYAGDENYKRLFTFVDVTQQIQEYLKRLPATITEFRKMLLGSVPDIHIGKHCHEPYECPFLNFCTPPQPDYPVTLLPHGGKTVEALLAAGFNDLRKVPKSRLTKPNHLRVWQATKSKRPELLHGAKQILVRLPYPRYYLDFETVQFAVPIWKATRPYQKLPFQWSCHVESADDSLEHKSFLDTSGQAPMQPFCESLLACIGPKGPILVYNAAFEGTVLEDLAQRFPKYAPRLRKLISRVVDLLPLTRDNYYHPEMKGSWSLKAVLPTIAPHLSYKNLGEVQESGAAPAAYLEIINPDIPTGKKAALIDDLQRYCERDTLATVALSCFLSK